MVVVNQLDWEEYGTVWVNAVGIPHDEGSPINKTSEKSKYIVMDGRPIEMTAEEEKTTVQEEPTCKFSYELDAVLENEDRRSLFQRLCDGTQSLPTEEELNCMDDLWLAVWLRITPLYRDYKKQKESSSSASSARVWFQRTPSIARPL